MQNKRIIIFDLDGTLVDSFEDIQASLNQALKLFGYPQHDLEAVKSFVGHGMETLVRRAVKGHLTDERVVEMVGVIMEYYALHPTDHARPYKGMLDLLEELKNRDLSLRVLSNKPHHLVDLVLQKCQLEQYFESYLGQKQGQPIKPDPVLLNEIAGAHDRREIVMIGDGDADAEFSRNAGIDFVGVSWGNGEIEHLAKFGVVAETVNDLRTILSDATVSSRS